MPPERPRCGTQDSLHLDGAPPPDGILGPGDQWSAVTHETCRQTPGSRCGDGEHSHQKHPARTSAMAIGMYADCRCNRLVRFVLLMLPFPTYGSADKGIRVAILLAWSAPRRNHRPIMIRTMFWYRKCTHRYAIVHALMDLPRQVQAFHAFRYDGAS